MSTGTEDLGRADEAPVSAQRVASHGRVLARLVSDPSYLAGDVSAFARVLTEACASALGLRRASVWFSRADDPRGSMECLDLHDPALGYHGSPPSDVAAPRPASWSHASWTQLAEAAGPVATAAPNGPVLDAPLRAGGAVVGLVRVERDPAGRSFSDDEIMLVSHLADLGSVALIRERSARVAVTVPEGEAPSGPHHDSVPAPQRVSAESEAASRWHEGSVAMRDAFARALARVASLDELVDQLLGALVENLRWDFASLFLADPDTGVLRCVRVSSRSDDLAAFADHTTATSLAPGVGLPGRVLVSAAPEWIVDLDERAIPTRAAAARAAGLVSACAAPVTVGSTICGVLEMFSRQRRTRERPVLALLVELGVRVGHYVERERLEAQLRAAEARLTLTLNAIRAGVWEVDLATGTCTWSDEVYRVIGCAPGEVEPSVGAVVARLHPDDRPELEAQMRQLTAGGKLELDLRVLRPDGVLRWVHQVANAELDAAGKPVRVRGILFDVSDRKAIEAQAQQLAGVAARTSNSVVVTDTEGRIEWVNDAFTALTGYSLDEARGRKTSQLLRGPATDQSSAARLHEAGSAHRPAAEEVIAYTKAGHQFWLSVAAQPIVDRHTGAASGFTVIGVDVTERRLADQRLDLKRRVASVLLRTQSLDAATPEILAALTEELAMPAAHLWRVDPGRDTLVYVGGCRHPSIGEDGDAFLAVTRSIAYRAGADPSCVEVGAPGAAWGTRATAHVSLIDAPSLRARAAAAIGVVTFTAVPILGPDGVLGVFEVDGAGLYPGYESLPQTLNRLAEQLAQFVLREAERDRFETVFEQSPDGMMLVDSTGHVRIANARAVALFGCEPGAHLDTMLEGGELLVHEALAEGKRSGRGLRLVERRGWRLGGEGFAAEANVACVRSPGDEFVVVVIRDLTERNRVQAALDHERQNLRALAVLHSALEQLTAAAPVALLLVGAEGTIVLANAEAARLFGRPAEALVGLAVRVILPTFDDDVAAGFEGAGTHDGHAIAADGTRFPVELRCNGIQAPQGAARLVSIVDLTERKRGEAALAASRDAAEAATRAKSDFLALMSHEIRTPLNAILGVCHLALTRWAEPAQRLHFQRVHDAAKGLVALLTDVLDFSKLDAGKLALERVAFSTEEVLFNAVDLFALRAEEKSIDLIASHDPRLPAQLLGDPLRLSQIVNNLVGNAIKFTPRGEVELRVALEGRSETEVWIDLEVRDTGIGIARETQAALFRPFAQADASTTRSYGGTGLGLSICRQLCDLMGGTLTLTSEVGVGTTLHARLPFGVVESEAPASARRQVVPELRCRRVLVVDDHERTRRVLGEMIAAVGGEAVGVGTATEALAALRAGVDPPFALVLVNRILPDMDGLQLERCIRKQRLAPAVVQMITASEVANGTRGESDAPLRKPIRPSHLHDVLAVALGTSPRRLASAHAPPPPRFHQARVLVVEDNEINQDIAVEMLRGLGVIATTASDGAEALRMITEGPRQPGGRPFDLVLMDVQMPVMNGLIATRAVRALSDPVLAGIPIVAMTAHALTGHREESLAAGMNGHLTKPIEPDDLERALARWLPAAPTPTRMPIDVAGGVRRAGGNEELYERLVDRFLEKNADVGPRLRTLLPRREDEARAIVGALRVAAASLGLDALARSAAALEHTLRSGFAWRKDLEALLVEHAATEVECRTQVSQVLRSAAASLPVGGLVELGALLDELDAPLRRRLAVRCREIAVRLEESAWPTEVAGAAAELARALFSFRFDEARALRDALFTRVGRGDVRAQETRK